MNRLARRAAARDLILFTFVLTGCGGSAALPGGGDDQATTITSASANGATPSIPDAGSGYAASASAAASLPACEAQASAQCALRDECTAGVANLVAYGSTSACVAQRTRECVVALESPDTGNSIAHVQTCADSLAGESCTDWWDGNSIAECRSPAGARGNGEPCGVNSQCASAFCDVPADSTCGSCADTPRPGDPCDSDESCGYDLDCPIVAPATTGVCTVRAQLGGACDGYRPCEGGLACIGAHTDEGTFGVCQRAETLEGAACNTETGPGCDKELDLLCSHGTCQRQSTALAGQPCGQWDGMLDVLCEAGAACITPAGSEQGTCVAAAAEGAACDFSAGPPCLAPAACVTDGHGGTAGTCVFPDAASCDALPSTSATSTLDP